MVLAAAAAAYAYQYGDSVSCTNALCEIISFDLSTGQAKKMNINGKDYVIEYVSFQKTERAYDYDTAVIKINGKSYDTEKDQAALQELLGVSYFRDYVNDDKKFYVTLTEESLCKGESKYNACYTKYEVPVFKGWNLVSLATVSLQDTELTTCDRSELEKNIFVYDVEKKKYWNLKELGSNTNYEKISENAAVIATVGSAWVHSRQDCKIVVKSEKETSSNFEKFFDTITAAMSQKKVNFPAGWNFFQILPNMAGKKLDGFRGSCQITRAYGWDPQKQSWDVLQTEFSKSAIGLGIVFKTSNECLLGEAVAAPPPLPA